MAKLIDLTGATVTVPAGWTATSDYGTFHAIGTTEYGEADFFYIGYDLGYFLPEIETDSIVCSLLPIKFQNGESFWITFSSGDDTSNPDLIQWFLDNNATIEGGVYEQDEQDEQLDTFLTEMGDAIREVKGTTGLINARDMIGIVRGMSGGEDLTTELSEYDELNAELEDVINSLPDAGGETEDLDAELTAQETKIAELLALLDAKASGGSGSLETCTVTINNTSGAYVNLNYNTVNSGEITCYTEPLTGSSSVTIEVLKNSMITSYLQSISVGHSLVNIEFGGGMSYDGTSEVRTFIVRNSGTITFTSNAGGWD